MRQSSAPPKPTCQIIHHGQSVMVCEAVAQEVRSHRMGKADAEAAQATADWALRALAKTCMAAGVTTRGSE